MSGGALDWIRDGVKEIGSHVSGMFRDDNAGGGNAGQTQGTGSSSSHSGGGSNSSSSHSGGASSYGQSAWSEPFKFDPNTHSLEDLKDLGCQGKAGIYLIRDEQDEHSLYVGKAEATSKDILSRLEAHLTGNGNAGIRERIEQGETLTVRWVECDDPKTYESVTMSYLLPTDNERCEYLGADRYVHIYEEMEIAVSLDLPSFWHANYADMVEEAKEEDLYVAGYGSNRIETAEAIFRKCNEEIKDDSTSGYESGHSSDRGNTNSQDSVGSLLGGLIGSLFSPIVDLFDPVGSESSKPDGVNSSSEPGSDSNSGDSSGSWFSGLFGGSFDGESDGYGSSDSGYSGGSNSGSGDSSNYCSSDSGYSGGYDSGSSDSYDSGSSDSGYSGGYDSGSSDSYDSGSSDSGYSGSYDSGSSDSYDSGSSDSGDSGDSDSGSSSDSWW